MNVPMRAGVQVIDANDPRNGEIGTTVDRTENGDNVVEFPDGAKRAYSDSQLKVL